MSFELKKDNNPQSMDGIIRKLEGDSFIGRNKEVEFFKRCITLNDQYVKVIHIYGPGGIGKSVLLGQFTRHADDRNILFLRMDSGDYPHTPRGFSEQILTLLQTKVNNLELNYDDSNQKLYQHCLNILSQISERHQIVIAI